MDSTLINDQIIFDKDGKPKNGTYIQIVKITNVYQNGILNDEDTSWVILSENEEKENK